MASTLEILRFLIRKAGCAAGKKIIYITTNPGEAARDLWEWIKANKMTCFLLTCGIIVVVVPPLIGFSAAGPVAGSLAAAWQASIGNVAAGSVFAIMQSLTMTGVLSGIGGGIIGAGVVRYLATCDWVSVAARSIANFITEHIPLFQKPLITMQELERILHRVDGLAQILPTQEQSRICVLMADLHQTLTRIAAIRRVYEAVQKLDNAITHSAPEAEIAMLVAELQVAADAAGGPDAGTGALQEQWDECCVRAYLGCHKLQRALNTGIANGTFSMRRRVRLVRELKEIAGELLKMTLSGAEQ